MNKIKMNNTEARLLWNIFVFGLAGIAVFLYDWSCWTFLGAYILAEEK